MVPRLTEERPSPDQPILFPYLSRWRPALLREALALAAAEDPAARLLCGNEFWPAMQVEFLAEVRAELRKRDRRVA